VQEIYLNLKYKYNLYNKYLFSLKYTSLVLTFEFIETPDFNEDFMLIAVHIMIVDLEI